MRASRVAACFWLAGEAGAAALWAPDKLNPSAFAAANVIAPAAPNCFKNARLVLSPQSIFPPCVLIKKRQAVCQSSTSSKATENNVVPL
jgi:hypothetical protein